MAADEPAVGEVEHAHPSDSQDRVIARRLPRRQAPPVYPAVADGDIGPAVAFPDRRRRDQERVIEEVDTAPVHLDEDELPLLLRRDEKSAERRRPGAASRMELGAAEADCIGPEADLSHGWFPERKGTNHPSY